MLLSQKLHQLQDDTNKETGFSDEMISGFTECIIHAERLEKEISGKWNIGMPDREHTVLMIVNVYHHDKFFGHEYIVGRIDETGSIVFMNDDSVGWEEDAIECWMELPNVPKSVEPIESK